MFKGFRNTFERDKAFEEATYAVQREKERLQHEFKERRQKDLEEIMGKLEHEMYDMRKRLGQLEAENRKLKEEVSSRRLIDKDVSVEPQTKGK